MNTQKAATLQWLALLAMTALTFGLAEAGMSGHTIILVVLAITLIKGRIVIDRFMALQGVGAPWRWVTLGWLAAVLGTIAYAFR
ncbi:MAG TPA: cytochrome C oxidase subunit IV family protein [Noviherbaspirillum sp.]